MLAVVPALPAAALTSEACPSTIPGAGFIDLGGLSVDAVDAIDCVAFYDITRGTSTNTFTPNGTVPRWQMAIFLVRTAAALGVSLPSGASQGFTDVGAFDSVTQTAINQLKQLGITAGTSPTTFNPNGTVPRWQMAIFITRLLARVGASLPSGTPQGFTDIATFDAFTQTAINQMKQLGITSGTSSTTYAPNLDVLRWQMALLLARSAESGGGFPYKITVTPATPSAQTTDAVTVTVTVRNADGTNAANRRVDLFVLGSLDANGRCVLDTDAKIGTGDAGTGTNCTIDNGDPTTDNQGRLTVTLTHTNVLEQDTIYAWTGENNEVFDLQDVRGEATATLTWVAPVTALDLPTSVAAAFGSTASVKAQLLGPGGVPQAIQGQAIRFTVRRGSVTILATSLTTGADGAATLTYVGPGDPTGGNDAPVTDTVTAFWDKDGDGSDDGAAEFDDSGTVVWDDGLPLATTAILSQPSVSSLVATSTSVTITVRDKFAQPVAGAEVDFVASTGPSLTDAVTNGAGQATFTYAGPAGNQAGSVDANVDLNGDGDTSDDGDLGLVAVVDLAHYWVEVAGNLAGTTEFDLLAGDAGANTIDVVVALGSQYLRLAYDTNDQFNVNGQPKTLAEFETALAALTLPDVDGPGNTSLLTFPYSAAPAAASVFVLTT
jgi:hypothetical protein